ncbi:MAG TPA: peptidoglycan-binding domain-containing protein [Thermoanaerobaculia bacterium]|nr:peptidoglycan-binding domain-containing protein [Thermoanaerobaculia bacterium]
MTEPASSPSAAAAPPLPYPGRMVEMGAPDNDSVRAIRQRLNQMGCGPLPADGAFDAPLRDAVKLFQARFSDGDGHSLEVDGRVGPITWASLFGTASVPVSTAAPSPLLSGVLDFAATQIGVREDPLGSNRGPQVDEYVRSVGGDPAEGLAWCAAFVYFCFDKAAAALGRANPVIRTAGVIDHWNKAGQRKIPRVLQADAVHDPSLVQPGFIFILSSGGGHGHTGLVAEVLPGKLVTIEGNTNEGGSREGIGVFRRDRRQIADITRGFIDYSQL